MIFSTANGVRVQESFSRLWGDEEGRRQFATDKEALQARYERAKVLKNEGFTVIKHTLRNLWKMDNYDHCVGVCNVYMIDAYRCQMKS